MDSYTQVILGAAVGEAVAGKKVGNWAIVWGGLAGLIPDLDPYFPPISGAIQWIIQHRGYSHSLLFALLTSPIFALLPYYLHRKKYNVSYWRWVLLWFLGLFTHALLDCLTVFGTQLLWPFMNLRIEVGSIAFRDYIYTGLLLAGLIPAIFTKRKSRWRTIFSTLAIVLSCSYLFFAGVNKIVATQKFKALLKEQNITYERLRSGPRIYTSWKWYLIAETDSAYYTTIYNVFDGFESRLAKTPKQWELLPDTEDKNVAILKWFSNDWYVVREQNDELYYLDMRFGNPWQESDKGPSSFTFGFTLTDTEDGIAVDRVRRDND